MQIRVIIFLISALIVALFAVVNIQPVTIDFIFGEAEVQLIFVIIISILIGALLMFILASMKQIKMSKQIKILQKEKEQKDESHEKAVNQTMEKENIEAVNGENKKEEVVLESNESNNSIVEEKNKADK